MGQSFTDAASQVFSGPIGEIAVVLAMAFVAGAAFSRMRLPTLPAYLLAGVVAGPEVLGVLGRSQTTQALGSVGVLVMLFVVGIKLDLRVLKRVGMAATLCSLAQIVVVGGLGLLVARAFGYGLVAGLYIGSAVAISSTVVVVKLLGDRKELDSLHGRLALAYLLVQDLYVALALFILPALPTAGESQDTLPEAFAASLGKIGVFGIAAIAAFFLFERLAAMAAWSRETGLVFLVMWMLAGASAAGVLGLGKEAGAFVAGVVINTASQGRLDVNRLGGLRDFLVPFYFLNLGAEAKFSGMSGREFALVGSLVMLAFVVKPLVLFSVLLSARFRARTATLTASTSGQISEFSLLLVAAGAAAGQVEEAAASAVLVASLATFVMSAFAIIGAPSVFARVEGALSKLEREGTDTRSELGITEAPLPPARVVVLGLGRIGGTLIEILRKEGMDYVGMDFDPVVVTRYRRRDARVFLGDAEDPDLAELLPLKDLKVVVATFRNSEAGTRLAHGLRRRGYQGKIVLAADEDEEAGRLLEAGADVVLVPYIDAAERAWAEVGEALLDAAR